MAGSEFELASDRNNLLTLDRLGKGPDFADEIFSLVTKSQFFTEFDRDEVTTLAGYMDVYRAPRGAVIIREGDPGDFMFLIIEGEVDILKTGLRGDPQHMASAGPGMSVGEMSMIDGEPRFATCVAAQTTTFAVMPRDGMAAIILDDPGLATKILVKLVTMLSLRLRQTSSRLLRYMER